MTTTQPAALPEDELRALYQRHELATTGLVLSDFKRIVSEAIALQPQPAAAVSDADVWELWLRVCAESENLSTRVMIANFARAILALRPQASGFQNALDIRTSHGWKLTGQAVPVLYTDEINGRQVMRDDVWLCTTEALRPQAVPMTEGERLAIAERYCTKNWTDNYLALIDAVIADVQAHHGITAQGAQGGEG